MTPKEVVAAYRQTFARGLAIRVGRWPCKKCGDCQADERGFEEHNRYCLGGYVPLEFTEESHD